jgi:hypothetical protein
MLETMEKPNLQDELGLAQLVGSAIFLAGLAFVLLTGNARASFFFLVVAVAVINIDYYVKKQTTPPGRQSRCSMLLRIQGRKFDMAFFFGWAWGSCSLH